MICDEMKVSVTKKIPQSQTKPLNRDEETLNTNSHTTAITQIKSCGCFLTYEMHYHSEPNKSIKHAVMKKILSELKTTPSP